MKQIAAILCLSVSVSLSVLAGCAHTDESAQDVSQAIEKTGITGAYRFVFEGDRKKAVLSELEKSLQGAALEEAKLEAEKEAEESVIEFTKDGRFVSKIGSQVIVDEAVDVEEIGAGVYRMSSGTRTTKVELLDGDTLLILDPEKGTLKFERID